MAFPFGAILSGDPMGAYQRSKSQSAKNYQEQLDEQASGLFGKSLQDMFQQQVPGAGPVPGAPIQGIQPTQPVGGGQPQGGGSPAAAAAPPAQPSPRQPQGGGGNAFGPNEKIMPAGGPSTSGQPQGGAGPSGDQGGGPQSQGPLTLQNVIQSVVKSAGPKADPAVVAAAVGKFVPLMNAQSQQQYREWMLGLREQGLMQAEQRIGISQQNQERLQKKDEGIEKHWQSLEQRHEESTKMAVDKFNNGLRNRNVSEAEQALRDLDAGYRIRQSDATNLGKDLSDAETKAYRDTRKQMQQHIDALKAMPQAGRQPPPGQFGGTMFQGAVQGGATVQPPQAPPVRDLTGP